MYLKFKIFFRAVFCKVFLVAALKTICVLLGDSCHKISDGGGFLLASSSPGFLFFLPLSLVVTASTRFSTIVNEVLCLLDVSLELLDFGSYIR